MTLGQWFALLGIASALYILWQIRQLVLLVFMAVVLAIAVNSLVRKLQSWGVKRRGLALLMTLIILAVMAMVFLGLIVPPFLDQFQQLVKLVPKGINQIKAAAPGILDYLMTLLPPGFTQAQEFLTLLKSMVEAGSGTPNLSNHLSGYPNYYPGSSFDWDLTKLPQQLTPIARNFFAFFNNALGATLQALFVLILTLMLVVSPRNYRDAFLVLCPSFYRRRADEILSVCEESLTNWLSGTLISSTGIAVLSGGGLALLGVDLALAHGLLAGLLNLIPNIGPVLSMVFPISVALLGPLWKVGAVVALYLFVQNIESYLLTPMVMAHQVSLLPALTLVAQIFFASTFGLLGLFLALPLTVVSKVWLQEWLVKDILDRQTHGFRRSSRWSSSHGPASPEVAQTRLLLGSGQAESEDDGQPFHDETLAHAPAVDPGVA